jgi:hypothetical protein
MSTRGCFDRGDLRRRRALVRSGACRPDPPPVPARRGAAALPAVTADELRALLEDTRTEALLRDDHPFRIYLHYEARARTIRQFAPLLVPDLLRTQRYRDALLPEMADDEPENFRREATGAVALPAMSFLLDEAVVRRTVGDAGVMREQLDRLETFARETGLSIRVVPFSSGTYRHMGESFTLLDFADPGLPPMVYVHGLDGCFITAEPRLVASYSRAFDSLELIASPFSDLGSVYADIFRMTEAG